MKKVKGFEVIECKGTPYEIGLQWGEGCKENILRAISLNEGVAHILKTTKEDITSVAMKYLQSVKDFDPDLVDMLKGQAAGAGVTFQDIFALKCGFDIGFYFPHLSNLCTSFAVTGKAARYGKTLLGQNVDWFPGTPMDVVKTVQRDGSVQLSLVLWGVVEYTLNSAGFGICANGTWANIDSYIFKLPIGCYLPKVMRQKNINDGFEILSKKARGLGYYHLASAEGQIIGIESVQDDYEIIHPQKDMMTHSNHYLTSRFKAVDMVETFVPDSLVRKERIRKLMNEHYGEMTVEVMISILSDHENHPTSICRHIDEKKPVEFASESIASFIMVPEERMMLIAYGSPCKFEYMEYSI